MTVIDFCAAHGWDCSSVAVHGRTGVQHLNAGRALCGSGCSGNPYDHYWPFDRLNWGESHEIGHGLQPRRLKIHGGAPTEVSCNLFPSHKWWRYNREVGDPLHGRRLDFAGTYELLQAGALTGDPTAALAQSLWQDGGVFLRLVFYWQLVYASRDLPHIGDGGWDVDFGSQASDRVAGFGFPEAPLQFWVLPDEQVFGDPLPDVLLIDGVTTFRRGSGAGSRDSASG